MLIKVSKRDSENPRKTVGHAQEKSGAGTPVSLAFPVSPEVVCHNDEQKVLCTSRSRGADDRQVQDEIE